MLNPWYRLLLKPIQANSAKRSYLEGNGTASSSASVAASLQHETKHTEVPTKKQFCHLSIVFQARVKEGIKNAEMFHLESNSWKSISEEVIRCAFGLNIKVYITSIFSCCGHTSNSSLICPNRSVFFFLLH